MSKVYLVWSLILTECADGIDRPARCRVVYTASTREEADRFVSLSAEEQFSIIRNEGNPGHANYLQTDLEYYGFLKFEIEEVVLH